jgi:hypothetical protein
MARFSAKAIGGPLDGGEIAKPYAPQHGTTSIEEGSSVSLKHAYQFCQRRFAWIYAGVWQPGKSNIPVKR